ncbi:MAG: SRPBCC domain-containing protein [Pseudolysinimonas sp.]
MTGYTLTWHFDVSPERVFRGWTEPELLGWFFNPEQPTPDEPVEVDLRVGGTWSQKMNVDDETRYLTGGVYREVVRDSGWSLPGVPSTVGPSSIPTTSTPGPRWRSTSHLTVTAPS